MAHTDACKIQVCQFVEKLIINGVSINQACKETERESDGIPAETIRSWWYAAQESTKQIVEKSTTPKPPKSHTKPGVKIQISDIAKEIKSGSVSDDHAKVIGDALADAITNGTCSKRVGTKVHTAVKKVNKNRKEVKQKDVDNYKRLESFVKGAVSGLTLLADGAIPPPESEVEADAAICIKAALPNLCLQIARLGVDLIEINETFYKGEQNETEYIDGQIN